jgi:universal stress protein A
MPAPFHRILVATDFSPSAQAAADTAGRIARALGGEIDLVHVAPLSTYAQAAAHARVPYSALDLVGKVTADSERQGQTEVARLAADGVTARLITVDGPPPAEIVRVARERDSDLIVMGTHGRTGLRSIALGSVAERVVHLAPCSVLVVRERGSKA